VQPLYIATERYGPWLGKEWNEYIEWSGLEQITELVSLDGMLCASVLDEIKDHYWPHIVNEDFMLNYFVDLEFLLEEVGEIVDKNVLCVFRNPPTQPVAPSDVLQFGFLGYDLVDIEGFASALSNCGGFAKSFKNNELNVFGLLNTHKRAFQVQKSLITNYPEEHHADCHVWAIFRAEGT